MAVVQVERTRSDTAGIAGAILLVVILALTIVRQPDNIEPRAFAVALTIVQLLAIASYWLFYHDLAERLTKSAGTAVCVGWAIVPLVVMGLAFAVGQSPLSSPVLSAAGIVWIAAALSYNQVLKASSIQRTT
ncbi:hypothetical protein CCICO_02885 [Corynebacterium ciconiae DSM 44920]|nr:hypothetical protein CCICO_02885 [Corynebacterium ciconiae DSM 44920]